MMNWLDHLLFLFSFCFVAWAAIATAKSYFSTKSRFEEFYFLLAVLNALGFYAAGAAIVFGSRATVDLIIIGQMHLTWCYYFLMMFVFKQCRWKKPGISKYPQVFFSIILSFGTIHTFAGGNPHYTREIIESFNLPFIMQLDYLADLRFTVSNQIIKLVFLASLAAFAWHRDHGKPTWIFFGGIMMFAEELLTLVNNVAYTKPSIFFFNVIQVLIVISNALIVADVVKYFKQKNRKVLPV